jgi:signal transduction histidine kinase
VADDLTYTSFLCRHVDAASPTVFDTLSGALRRQSTPPVREDLQARFAMRSVLSVRIRGKSVEGRLFCLDMARMTSDDLVVGEVLGQQVAAQMDLFHALSQLKEVATVEERLRLARDLHDGVLQSLAAITMKLWAVEQAVAETPGPVRDRVQELQVLVADEQRLLRSFISELRPGAEAPAPRTTLTSSLEGLVSRIERQWGLRVDLNSTLPEPWGDERIAREIYLIVHEALVNVARHAQASAATVELRAADHEARIVVRDDGRGFSFHGHHDHAQLTALGLGPLTLRERIGLLGGTMSIDSSPNGARLEIVIPFGPPAG